MGCQSDCFLGQLASFGQVSKLICVVGETLVHLRTVCLNAEKLNARLFSVGLYRTLLPSTPPLLI